MLNGAQPWTFSPVDAQQWATSPRRVLLLGAEPNGEDQLIQEIGEVWRQQLLHLSGHGFVRNTLLMLHGARTSDPVPNLNGQVDYAAMAAAHLLHLRFCDIRPLDGGPHANVDQVRAWYRQHAAQVHGFWTGANGVAPPHVTVVLGQTARDLFVTCIKPQLAQIPALAQTQFVGMMHPSAHGLTAAGLAAFVPSMMGHFAALNAAQWSWAKQNRQGILGWHPPYVGRRCECAPAHG